MSRRLQEPRAETRRISGGEGRGCRGLNTKALSLRLSGSAVEVAMTRLLPHIVSRETSRSLAGAAYGLAAAHQGADFNNHIPP